MGFVAALCTFLKHSVAALPHAKDSLVQVTAKRTHAL